MAATFKSATSQNFASAATWTITKPENLADGDWVVVTLTTDTSHTQADTYDGFSWLGTGTDSNSDSSTSVLAKYVSSVAGEPAWTIDWSGTSTEEGIAGIHLITGGDPNATITVNITDSGFVSTITPPAVNPPDNGACLLAGAGSDPAGAITAPATAGNWTRALTNNNGTLGYIASYYIDQAVAGSESLSANLGVSDRYVEWSLYIPAAAVAVSAKRMALLGVG